MLENALFVTVNATAYLESYWTEFHQTFSVDALWDRDERFNFWGQKVKGQGHVMSVDHAADGGI